MSRQLRFFFSYGVDTPLWPDDADFDSPYGYPCDPALLPVTEATAHALTHLADRYQSSLDWDDPGGPSPGPRTGGGPSSRSPTRPCTRSAPTWAPAGR
ncbi:hypothetical protein [Streptomyces sp. NPDC049906]|uniref:hypothetical protein n=1 Tax=Streptomyces sp. NPDC049906 TaxID=3155656 RepID=UPI003413DE03